MILKTKFKSFLSPFCSIYKKIMIPKVAGVLECITTFARKAVFPSTCIHTETSGVREGLGPESTRNVSVCFQRPKMRISELIQICIIKKGRGTSEAIGRGRRGGGSSMVWLRRFIVEIVVAIA